MLFPLFFFFNDTATTEIYTLSLHDALPIYQSAPAGTAVATPPEVLVRDQHGNPVPGVSVTFGVAAGGGSVNPTSPLTTGPDGLAPLTSWAPRPTEGTNTLTPSSARLTRGPGTFTATRPAGA